MKYDIEVDWHLLDTCNYRCSYCFYSADRLGSKLSAFASAPTWRSAFDTSGKVWLVHITGGEPSAYPDFVALSEGLTVNHYISVNSNLTGPSLAKFSERVDPSRVSFINAGLHLEERECRSGTEGFLRNADRLRCAGFPILVSAVATPVALERFDEAIALLAPVRLFPIPKLLRGAWNGRYYPNAYTVEDKRRFRRFSALAREFYGAALARRAEPPSLDMLHDDAFVDGVPDFTGLMCEAGRRFVQMVPNGDVFRCGAKDFQGNLLDGSFKTRLNPAPCDSRHCYYFCNKYAIRDTADAAAFWVKAAAALVKWRGGLRP
jgi:MoaA/NifB/PqqE/SkfB family radical SAM enzyme